MGMAWGLGVAQQALGIQGSAAARCSSILRGLYESIGRVARVQANGFAVRELLKVASLLHDAYRNASKDGDDVSESVVFDIGPGHKFTDMRTTRAIAADITRRLRLPICSGRGGRTA